MRLSIQRVLLALILVSVAAKPNPRPLQTLLAHKCCILLEEKDWKKAGRDLDCDKWLCTEHYDPQRNKGMLLSDGSYLFIADKKAPKDDKGNPTKIFYVPQLSIKQAKDIQKEVVAAWDKTTLEQDHETMHIKGEGKIRLGWNLKTVPKKTSEIDTIVELMKSLNTKLNNNLESMVTNEKAEREAFLTKGTIPKSTQANNGIKFDLNKDSYKAQCSVMSEECTPYQFYERGIQHEYHEYEKAKQMVRSPSIVRVNLQVDESIQSQTQHHHTDQINKATIRRRLKHVVSDTSSISTSADVDVDMNAGNPYEGVWPKGFLKWNIGPNSYTDEAYAAAIREKCTTNGLPPRPLDDPTEYFWRSCTEQEKALVTAKLGEEFQRLKALMLNIFELYESRLGLRFFESIPGALVVRFEVGGGEDGSFSHGIGMQSNRIVISTHMLSRRVLIHEIGHALGLEHTNKRSDAASFVTYREAECRVAFFSGDMARNCRDIPLEYRKACDKTTHFAIQEAVASLPAWIGYAYPKGAHEDGLKQSPTPQEIANCAKWVCAYAWQAQYTPLSTNPNTPFATTPAIQYDYGSIMHYPLGPCLQDLRVWWARLKGKKPQENELTEHDIAGLRSIYQTIGTVDKSTAIELVWAGVTRSIFANRDWDIIDLKKAAAHAFGQTVESMARLSVQTADGIGGAGTRFDDGTNILTTQHGHTIGTTEAPLFLVGPMIRLNENPDLPYTGGSITIHGVGFEGVQGTGTVTFNGAGGFINQVMGITRWGDRIIVINVPAAIPTTQFNTDITISITSNAGNARGPAIEARTTFQYHGPSKPTITSLTTTPASNPPRAAAGTAVTITGTNFLTPAGVLSFNNANVATTSWTDTQIVFTLPAPRAGGPIPIIVKTKYEPSNGIGSRTATKNDFQYSP